MAPDENPARRSFRHAAECPCNGLFRQVGRNPAGAEIAQDARPAEPVAFDAQRCKHFGESLIVEVADFAEPGDYGIHIRYFLRAAPKLRSQFLGRIRACGQGPNRVLEQCVSIQSCLRPHRLSEVYPQRTLGCNARNRRIL
jgi:hypothetical protein